MGFHILTMIFGRAGFGGFERKKENGQGPIPRISIRFFTGMI
jgi:hypothetical protein